MINQSLPEQSEPWGTYPGSPYRRWLGRGLRMENSQPVRGPQWFPFPDLSSRGYFQQGLYFVLMESSSCSGPAPAYKCQEQWPALALHPCQALGCEFSVGRGNPGTPMRRGPPCLSSRKQPAWGPFESECPHERVASGRTSGNLGATGTIGGCLGGMKLAGTWHSALRPCKALPSLGLVSHCLSAPGCWRKRPVESSSLLQSPLYSGKAACSLFVSCEYTLPRLCCLADWGAGMLRTSLATRWLETGAPLLSCQGYA